MTEEDAVDLASAHLAAEAGPNPTLAGHPIEYRCMGAKLSGDAWIVDFKMFVLPPVEAKIDSVVMLIVDSQIGEVRSCGD